MLHTFVAAVVVLQMGRRVVYLPFMTCIPCASKRVGEQQTKMKQKNELTRLILCTHTHTILQSTIKTDSVIFILDSPFNDHNGWNV